MVMSGRTAVAARRGRDKARWIGALALTGLMSLPALTAPLAHASPIVKFRPAQNYSVGSNPESIATADLNGDGHLDLVETNDGGHTFEVLFGNGDGTFQSPVVYCLPYGATPADVAIGDFNNDGHPDLAITDANQGKVYIYLGDPDGDGSFTLGTTVNSANESNGLYGIAIGDLNKDGNMDLVFTDPGNNQVDVARGYGDGTFHAAVAHATSWNPQQVVIGDFNGDTNPDVAVTAATGNVVSILLGDGCGSLGTHDDFAAGTNAHGIVAYDFNQDGKLDLAVTSQYGFTILFGNGDGTFQDGVIYWSENDCGYYAIALGDFNNDGTKDLAVSGGCDGGIYIFLGDSDNDGTFSYETSLCTSGWVESIATGLFDVDSRSDIATANWDDNSVSVYLTTQPPRIHLVFGSPQQTVGDTLYVTDATTLCMWLTDEGNGADSIVWRVYAVGSTPPGWTTSNTTSVTAYLTALPQGNYEIEYYGVGDSNITGDTQTAYFTVQTQLPSASLTVGTPNAMTNGHQAVTTATPLTLTGTDTMSGVASVSYRIYLAGGTAPSYTTVSGTSTNPSLAELPDGIYHVDFYATDALGLVSPVGTTTLQIITGAPATALTWSGANVTVNTALYINGKSQINLQATGPAQVASISYRVFPQGGTAPAYTTVSGSKKSFTLGGKADGTYELDYYATDVLGNVETMHTLTFVLDQHAPTMSINANGAGQRTVTILATDSGSGVTTIYYRVYLKGSTAPAYSSVSGASKSFTITGVAGTYLVDYYSVDAVGNLSTVHRLTVGVTGVWNCPLQPGTLHATC